MKHNQRKWLADLAVIVVAMAAVTALGIVTGGLW